MLFLYWVGQRIVDGITSTSAPDLSNSLVQIAVPLFLLYWFGQRTVVRILAKLYPSILFYNKKTLWTFDDVPYSIESFTQLLDWLQVRNIKAVLFVISDQVTDESRALLIKAIYQGHTLGNHGRTDSRAWSKSSAEFLQDMDHCDQLLNDLYLQAGQQRKRRLYRPGSGLWHNAMIRLVQDRGYRIMLGSVYPYDPVIRWAWLNALFINWHVRSKDIIIVHDRPWTADLLQRINRV